MATLFELSKSISPVIVRIQQANVIRERTMSAYQKRMNDLQAHENVFEECRQARPKRKRFRNTVCSEKAGRIGTRLSVRHALDGHEIVCRCKVY